MSWFGFFKNLFISLLFLMDESYKAELPATDK
jgi:hypothetical protein